VLFVHWYEEPAQNADRTQFLPDALALGRRGVASLLVDTPWSEPKWFGTRDPAQDHAMSVRQVKALRRQLDVLASLAEVDPKRIAFVGHDFGAMFGAVVASVDRRPKALVFIAGTTDFSEWYLLGRKLDAEARRRVEQELAPLAPLRHVPRVTPAALLFQFARTDPYVPREAADALVSAARDPKEARFYECGHEMNRDAMRDRVAWLVRTLEAGAGKP
jgi:predicted esterase